MNYPDKPTTLAMLVAWKDRHDSVEKMMDGIKEVMGLEIGGPLFETVWGVYGAYEAMLGAFIGDHGEWLEWYQAENEMGARGMEAGYDGNLNPVKTLDDLWRLIEEARKRAAS